MVMFRFHDYLLLALLQEDAHTSKSAVGWLRGSFSVKRAPPNDHLHFLLLQAGTRLYFY